ncbi:MAG: hypothetical protein HWD58_04500 [Bacteroidota bacterium]|nr:MAG: hypothetical protein HWD58_04500 [Bacteroidota bacterium]
MPANIGNGGTLSISKLYANPSLPSSQQAAGTPQIQGQPAAPTIRVASQTTTSAIAAPIPSTGNGLYYATYRITNSVAFAQNAVMSFTPVVNSSPTTKTRTLVSAYVNGATNGGTAFSVLGSTIVQSALRVLGIVTYPSITLNQPTSTCPTAGTANVTDPTCFGGLGSAVVTLTPNPSPATGTYSVDGGAATAYTSNPFTVSGLSQGSHTVTVTNDPNCAPFDVVLTVGGPSAPPPPPSLACYQTATFNSTTCQWDVTGTQPAMPNLACYQTASFNNTTCQWDVTGTQPAMPGLACYETASFNTTTCQWDVTGSMPAMPSLACYQTASFNTTTCQWDVTGSMPPMPALACYETASFNNTTCQWDVTGSMPAMPSLACYQTASFNTTTCQWDVTGSMPPMPALACYETASFNNTTCQWDVTGSMPAMPGLACYQTASFNTTTCQWDVTGSMPPTPALACYQTASFNNTTCQWDVTGTMPAMPGLACYETASFNNTTCQWDVTGTMPAMPSLACYQTASFNTTTCQWDVTGTQPAAPTGLACYETATFNNTTCQWDVTGSMPAMPNLACYQTASFNTTTCQWDVTGTPNAPIITTYSGCDSYTWSVNNATYTSSGTYTVNLACQDYILYLTLGQTTSSTITINAPLSYTWSCNNTTYTTSGTYTCSGTNASGCPDTQTLILNIGGCNLTVTAANVTGCPNSPITLSGTPAGGTFYSQSIYRSFYNVYLFLHRSKYRMLRNCNWYNHYS